MRGMLKPVLGFVVLVFIVVTLLLNGFEYRSGTCTHLGSGDVFKANARISQALFTDTDMIDRWFLTDRNGLRFGISPAEAARSYRCVVK